MNNTDIQAPQFDLLTPKEQAQLKNASPEEIQAYLARPEIMLRVFKAVGDNIRGDNAEQPAQ